LPWINLLMAASTATTSPRMMKSPRLLVRKGSIIVSVQRAFPDVNTMTTTISDDGEGFKAQTESKRHGLGLVRRLVEQVRGIASLDSENGTVRTIKIPVPCSASLGAIEPNIVGVGQEAGLRCCRRIHGTFRQLVLA
jgi:hypothetical protein